MTLSKPLSKLPQFRLQRSVLSVPAINSRLFLKSLNSDADCIMFDCEDSVAINDKQQARQNVVAALGEFDWRGQRKTSIVRINGPDTAFMYRDLIDVVEQSGENIDTIMVPKVSCAADIYMIDRLLNQVEQSSTIRHKIGIEALIETASAAIAVNEIAVASNRLEALHFGAGDFAASCGARIVEIGGLTEYFPGEPWHPVMQSIVLACRANGLRPIDSAYGDYSDSEGYIASARRAAALGFSGKWAIHPSQIPLANEVMTPSGDEVKQARKILGAMEQAAQSGMGAATLDGRMVDVASIRMAQNIVALDDALSA